MAWIKTVDETNADGELARTYDELRQRPEQWLVFSRSTAWHPKFCRRIWISTTPLSTRREN